MALTKTFTFAARQLISWHNSMRNMISDDWFAINLTRS